MLQDERDASRSIENGSLPTCQGDTYHTFSNCTQEKAGIFLTCMEPRHLVRHAATFAHQHLGRGPSKRKTKMNANRSRPCRPPDFFNTTLILPHATTIHLPPPSVPLRPCTIRAPLGHLGFLSGYHLPNIDSLICSTVGISSYAIYLPCPCSFCDSSCQIVHMVGNHDLVWTLVSMHVSLLNH